MLEIRMLGQDPIRRLVSVNNDLQFIGTYRAACLNRLLPNKTKDNVLPFKSDHEQVEHLRNLKLILKDTGLAELPETDAEIEALYRRFDA